MRKQTKCLGENKGADQLRGNNTVKIQYHLSHCMRKQTKCLGENKGADQLRGNREPEQRLCFRYMDCTIPLLLKCKISSLYPSSVTVQPGLCRTWSEPKLLVFSCTGSFPFQPQALYALQFSKVSNFSCTEQNNFHRI